MPNTLFLRLEGPLQSWGERGQWGVRDSAPEPTKSAVVGLLGCALGWREDSDLRALSDSFRMAVRCDRPGVRLTDYHTVGGGYETPQLLTAALKLARTPAGQPHTELTWRDYLCDASFLVALQAHGDLIAQLSAAVRDPLWPIFLGRKACIPSLPPYESEEEYPTLLDALNRPWRTDRLSGKTILSVRAVIETTHSQGVRRSHGFLSRVRRPHGAIHTTDVMVEIVGLPLVSTEEPAP